MQRKPRKIIKIPTKSHVVSISTTTKELVNKYQYSHESFNMFVLRLIKLCEPVLKKQDHTLSKAYKNELKQKKEAEFTELLGVLKNEPEL